MLSESQVIAVFGALAQETRLRIVRALVTAGEPGLAAGELASATGVSPSNLSFHLKELERAELVVSRREQRSIIYVCRYETLDAMQGFLMANCCAGAGAPTANAGTRRGPTAPRVSPAKK